MGKPKYDKETLNQLKDISQDKNIMAHKGTKGKTYKSSTRHPKPKKKL